MFAETFPYSRSQVQRNCIREDTFGCTCRIDLTACDRVTGATSGSLRFNSRLDQPTVEEMPAATDDEEKESEREREREMETRRCFISSTAESKYDLPGADVSCCIAAESREDRIRRGSFAARVAWLVAITRGLKIAF